MRSWTRTLMASVAIGVGLLPLAPAPALAGTLIIVTSTADVVDGGDGVLSLREAVTAASTAVSPVTLVLGSSATYTLTICAADDDTNAAGDLDVSGGRITILGNDSTVDSTCPGQRVIDALAGVDDSLAASSLTVQDLTLTGGNGPDGISVRSRRHLALDTVTVTGAVGSGSGSDPAGAVLQVGPTTITVVASTITQTTGGSGILVDPAGAAAGAAVTVSGSVISENSSPGVAGGIDAPGSSLLVDHSRIEDNSRSTPSAPTVTIQAGGMIADTLVLSDSTVAGNSGAAVGGAATTGHAWIARSVFDGNGGPDSNVGAFLGSPTIVDSTFSANAGLFVDGVGVMGGSSFVRTSIDAGTMPAIAFIGQAPEATNSITQGTVMGTVSVNLCCAPPTVDVVQSIIGGCEAVPATPFAGILVTSHGHNYVPDLSCSGAGPDTIGTAPGDLVGGGDPMLAPLADNGGPTPTMLPLPGSPVIDRIVANHSGSEPKCPDSAVDQRGAPRPQGLACDIGAVEAPFTPTPGAGYHPLDPVRIHDSRDLPAGPLTGGVARTVPVGGLGGIPASGVSAVVLNVTATATSTASHLTIWPTEAPMPDASSLNWIEGETNANLVTVALGPSGQVNLRASSGTAHVVVDVAGWFDDVTAPTGDRLTTVTPLRLMDSRAGTGTALAPLGAGEEREVVVGGAAGLPAYVDALVVNLTAVSPSAATHLTAWPSGSALPGVSNLNVPAGTTAANLAIVKVGADGKIRLRNNAGLVDVIGDVFGYFRAGTGLRFHAVTPLRIADTRDGTGNVWGPVGPGGVQGVRLPPAFAGAILANLTAVNPTATTHLGMQGGAMPFTTSNLNVVAGHTRPNAVLSGVDAGGLFQVRNNSGEVDAVVDLAGWFA